MSNLFLPSLGLHGFQTRKDHSPTLFQIQTNKISGKIIGVFRINKHLANSQMYTNIGSFRLKFTCHPDALEPYARTVLQ